MAIRRREAGAARSADKGSITPTSSLHSTAECVIEIEAIDRKAGQASNPGRLRYQPPKVRLRLHRRGSHFLLAKGVLKWPEVMAPEEATGVVVPGAIPAEGGALAGIPGAEVPVGARGASGRGKQSSIRSRTAGVTPSTLAQPTIPDAAQLNTERPANSVTGTGWSSRPRPFPESPPKASSGASLPRSARGTDVTPDTTPQAMAGSTGAPRS